MHLVPALAGGVGEAFVRLAVDPAPGEEGRHDLDHDRAGPVSPSAPNLVRQGLRASLAGIVIFVAGSEVVTRHGLLAFRKSP